jgi:2,3-bisphosphoglycerate-dependent phosphoglycerate mutase
MFEVLFVRHGQSEADIQGRYEGRANFELTSLGVTQAEQVAEWIRANYPPQVIISSPPQLAAQTAQIIGAAIGVGPLYDGLVEWNNGLLAGCLKSETSDQFLLTKNGPCLYQEPYGTESKISFRARDHIFWSKTVDTHNQEGVDRRVCLVSHDQIIGMLFRSFLDLPMDSDIGITTGNTGVHLWRLHGKNRKIVFSYSQVHLGMTLK